MSTWVRAQASAAVASAVDLLSTVFFVAIAGVYAPMAGALGSLFGGALNFTLNRNWAFAARARTWQQQMQRYLLVWAGHVLLSYGLLWFGNEMLAAHYLPVKLSVMLLLALGYNYPLHRHYVFRT